MFRTLTIVVLVVLVFVFVWAIVVINRKHQKDEIDAVANSLSPCTPIPFLTLWKALKPGVSLPGLIMIEFATNKTIRAWLNKTFGQIDLNVGPFKQLTGLNAITATGLQFLSSTSLSNHFYRCQLTGSGACCGIPGNSLGSAGIAVIDAIGTFVCPSATLTWSLFGVDNTSTLNQLQLIGHAIVTLAIPCSSSSKTFIQSIILKPDNFSLTAKSATTNQKDDPNFLNLFNDNGTYRNTIVTLFNRLLAQYIPISIPQKNFTCNPSLL